MKGSELKQQFNITGLAVFPVIHVLDQNQASTNISIAMEQGVAGVFLINHDFGVDVFLPIIRSVRAMHPDIWVGLNFLAVTGKDAFVRLAQLDQEGFRIDGYWADDARIDESRAAYDQREASEILDAREKCGWDGLYFGGTAFKKQRPVAEVDYHHTASIAAQWMDVVTTSGIATGQEADMEKVDVFRDGVGKQALALASGITPENVGQYADALDAVLVATGINYTDDFYNIDPVRLGDLMARIG
jgi:predicted TIM-barrel enzyme